MKQVKLIAAILLLFCMSCSNVNDGVHHIVGDVIYIKDFPCEDDLKEIDGFKNYDKGIRSVKVVDSLLFIAQRNKWIIRNLNNPNDSINILSNGTGPLEFMDIPRGKQCAYVQSPDSLVVYMPDFMSEKILSLNVTELLKIEIPSQEFTLMKGK